MKDGLVDWVFLALGSSSMTARFVFSLIMLRPPRRFSVLDSSHPCSICRLKESIDFNRTCFILSSKASDKLEDHALLLYFQSLFKNATVSNVSQPFASLTESNSFLSGISQGYSFRASFLDPPDILSSYCSVLHFKALMTGLSVIEPQTALSSIRAMRDLCKADSESNPALQLAASLSSAAMASCRYLILLTSPSLAAYSNRLSHLIGGSMAKQACGIIPASGDVPRITKGIQDRAAFVFLTFAGDGDTELNEKMETFRIAGVPHVSIQVLSVMELLPETFKW